MRRASRPHAFDLRFAAVNFITGANEEGVHFLPAKTQVGSTPVGRRIQDTVHPAGLITKLDAHGRANVEPPLSIERQTIGSAAGGIIFFMEVIVALAVSQSAVLPCASVKPAPNGIGRSARATRSP